MYLEFSRNRLSTLFLLVLLWVGSSFGGVSLSDMRISENPIDTNVTYDGSFLDYTSGEKLPIAPQEGIYQLEFTVEGLGVVEIPTLYLGPLAYPARVYVDGEEVFRWGHTLSGHRMQTVRPFAVDLRAKDKEKVKISIIFFTEGQLIAFHEFRVGSYEDIDHYVFIQEMICSDGVKVISILSFLLGFVILFYYLLSKKKHREIFFVGLFALSEGFVYVLFVVDGGGMGELLWYKLSRIPVGFSMCFLLSSNLLLIGSKSKGLKVFEKLAYGLSFLVGGLMLFADKLIDVGLYLNLSGVLIVYPIFGVIFYLLCKRVFFEKNRESLLLLFGFLAVMITSSLDLYYLISATVPYAWFSAYGQFLHIIAIIATIGYLENEFHQKLVVTTQDLGDVNRELVSTQEALKEESRLREGFIKAVSHELRTPLNAIVGIVGELMDEKTPEHKSLSTSINRLRLAIANIFNYQRLGEEEKGLLLLPMNPIEVGRGVFKIYSERAEIRDLDFELDWDASVDASKSYVGNAEYFESVLSNVVSNAIKFTAEGFVKVNMSYEKGCFRVVVKDSGCGFTDEKINDINQGLHVEQSYQHTTNQNKVGIGIRIIQDQIRKMKGGFWVSNDSENGAVVSFSIPMEPMREINKQPRGLKVLIVEDNKMNQKVLTKILDKQNVEYSIANNGQEALDELFASLNDYALILMDVQMPIMNGLECTRELRKLGYEIPIVALTANADKNECLDAGMQSYMSKPFSSKVLKEVIRSYS